MGLTDRIMVILWEIPVPDSPLSMQEGVILIVLKIIENCREKNVHHANMSVKCRPPTPHF